MPTPAETIRALLNEARQDKAEMERIASMPIEDVLTELERMGFDRTKIQKTITELEVGKLLADKAW